MLNLAIAECMKEPSKLSLYERLLLVKPEELTRNAWAKRAGVSGAVWTDIKKRDAAKLETIEKLLAAIGLSLAQFDEGQSGSNDVEQVMRAPVQSFAPATQRPRDVPVLGSASCGHMDFDDEQGLHSLEAFEIDRDEVVDYLRRPVALDGRKNVYAVYFVGHSMEPRFEPGEPAFVDPDRQPRPLDYAIVQLRGPDFEDGERVERVLAKRIVRTSASFVELEQFNPPTVVRVPAERIKSLHRIIPWSELTAF